MSEELCFTSACELLTAFRARTLSPVEVAEAVFARIEQLNPILNCYCYTDVEASLAAAKASEQRWNRGEPQGLLDGIPVSIKDVLLTRGWPTLKGSRTVDPAGPWEDDDPAVARLREHGAVLLGKTTTPEFATSGVTDSLLTGITVNPWDITRTTGGSSGGSVSAVAAGLGPCSMGTDAGGSIRTPSSFCGLVGLKPTFGRVPQFPGDDWGELLVSGPITRTVTDAVLMMNVLTQPDARDWNALESESRDYLVEVEAGVAGRRIAFTVDYGYMPVDPEVASIVSQAAGHFEELGAEVVEAHPDFGDAAELLRVLFVSQILKVLSPLSEAQRELLCEENLEYLEEAQNISILDYLETQERRAELVWSMRRFHETYDLLVTPGALITAFETGHLMPPGWNTSRLWHFEAPMFLANLTRQPAIAVPCGFTESGLPVGLQILGPRCKDAQVMAAAHAYQQAFPLTDRRPPLDS